jgi:hypothetical protein
MNRSAACTGNTFGKGDEAVITACAEEYDPHSHSILSAHRNALISKRNSVLLTVKTRPSSRQNSSLLISKENSRFKFSAGSTTIANDRSIFRVVNRGAHFSPG